MIHKYSCIKDSQILIFGDRNHAEMATLVGQTNGRAIVITSKNDLQQVNFSKKIYLFSQTTMSVNDFKKIIMEIKNRMVSSIMFFPFNTICRQILNRLHNLCKFASQHNLILFVAGEKSSNGRVLLNECKRINPNTYFVSNENDIQSKWIDGIESIGICGSTSTPKWLMEKVALSLISYY